MKCTCDEVHELNPLDPESELCPIHDVDYDDEADDWENYWGMNIIDEIDQEMIDS